MKKNLEINLISFAFVYALLNLILFHKPLFYFAFQNTQQYSMQSIIIFAELFIIQIFTMFFIVVLLSLVSNKIVKPICIILLVANSIAYYFIAKYNIMLDKTMMGNIFNTDTKEASELFSYTIFVYIALLGVLPSVLLAKIKITPSLISTKILTIIGFVLFVITFGYANSKTWLWADRYSKQIGGLLLPESYIGNSIRHYNKIRHEQYRVEKQLPQANFAKKSKTLVVLVIGESARADNFSLYGYNKNTNPNLQNDNIAVMQNTNSCATYTSGAIKCMLSHLGSKVAAINDYEFLPSYLNRSGVDVFWYANNSGEPKFAIKKYTKTDEIRDKCDKINDKMLCKNIQYDEAMITQFKQDIKTIDKNTLITLHQTGSHGPLYSSKYPKEFEKFTPVCKTVNLQSCTQNQLQNAYDNTILYTDHFLHETIKTIKQNFKNLPVVLIYMSDHGESLGENNFYLHSTPYLIAPHFQKNIPFLVWMSDEFKTQNNITNKDLQKQKSHSQDNIFHSIMGAFKMKSDIYNQKLDIFSKNYEDNN